MSDAALKLCSLKQVRYCYYYAASGVKVTVHANVNVWFLR